MDNLAFLTCLRTLSLSVAFSNKYKNSWGNIFSLDIWSSSSSGTTSSGGIWRHWFYICLTVFSNIWRSGCSHSSWGFTFLIQILIRLSDMVKPKSMSALLSTFSSRGRLAQPGGADISLFSLGRDGSYSSSRHAISLSFILDNSLQIKVHAYMPCLTILVGIILRCHTIKVAFTSLTFDTDSRELKY